MLFRNRPFGELFAEPTRNGLTRPKAVRGAGTKMVNMGELFANQRIGNIPMDRVPLSQAEADRALLKAGDLLFARQSLVLEGAGKCSIFLGDEEPVTFESHVTRVRLNQDEADPRFYFYWLQSFNGRNAIRSIVEQGAGAAGIRGSDLQNLSVVWCPVEIQREIADVLSVLDDTIELNRRMNETLEAMARALFQSWFVDFDPVRAKVSGESTDSICQRLGLTPELLAGFPGSFEDSELGEIPEGWNAVEFFETIQIIGGGTPKTSVESFWGGDIPWFSVVDAPPESDVYVIDTEKKITKGGLDNSSTKLLPEGTTIISARGTVGKVALVGMPMAMNQSCYGLRGRNGCDIYTYYATKELVSALKRHSHGAVFDTITRDTFASVKVVLCDGASKAFDAVVASNMQRIKANGFHTKYLTKLRDVLLPKLLSGELKLQESEVV